ncbi:MAG: hypothetical protein ABUL77_04600 [Bacteroidota bacterium]
MRLGKLGAIATASVVVVAAAATALGLGPRPRVDAPARPADETQPIARGDGGTALGAGATGEAPPEPKQRGVALGLFAEDVSFSYVPLLREIAALGATHVALIVPLYQTDGRSTDLALHTRFSPTLELIADTVRAAKRERLEVTLFPIIRLARPAPGEWRGTLAPVNRDRWFRSYGDLLGDLAAVAAQTGATRLVVGSELSTLDDDLRRWRPLLERVRAIFPGHLVYSANWDHYRDARVFDLVDEDGVVGYFSLRADPRGPATEAALEAAWRRHKEDLLRWHGDSRHPLVFTEVGYRSRVGSTASPWDELPGGTPDAEEQRRAFAAFRRVWARAPALDGAYVWNWYGWGGDGSVSYTARGKPAEKEVRLLLESL